MQTYCHFDFIRPSKLYNMTDTVMSPPLSPPGSSAPSTRNTPERGPPLLDLDITLEDKDKVF